MFSTEINASFAATGEALALLQLDRTPALLLGPYYPVNPPESCGTRLWQGGSLPPHARTMVLDGHVMNVRHEPVAGANVEIWHADPGGVYPHPSDVDHRSALTGFAGYGSTHSDSLGRFVFQTVEPGPYAVGSIRRAPHIHVQVTGRIDRLVTQLFFPAHPLNTTDRWYRAVANPGRLLATVTRDDDAAIDLQFTLVLNNG